MPNSLPMHSYNLYLIDQDTFELFSWEDSRFDEFFVPPHIDLDDNSLHIQKILEKCQELNFKVSRFFEIIPRTTLVEYYKLLDNPLSIAPQTIKERYQYDIAVFGKSDKVNLPGEFMEIYQMTTTHFISDYCQSAINTLSYTLFRSPKAKKLIDKKLPLNFSS